MENIVAAVDFSPVTDKLLQTASSCARAFGARLWLVHVAPLDGEPADYEAGPENVRKNVAKGLREEHRNVQKISQKMKAEGIDSTPILVDGDVHEQILKQVKKTNGDMIIVGSHGQGGILEKLFGSVCESIVHGARVPVLIVPSRAK